MKWIRSDNVVWEELDGCALLVDTMSGARWRLSHAASAAWKLCDGTRTLAEIGDVARQSGAGIIHFCRRFEELGLLRAIGPQEKLPIARLSPNEPLGFHALGLGSGPRRRPTPRGNSGPG